MRFRSLVGLIASALGGPIGAQTITGIVIDAERDRPVPFAFVAIDGTTHSTRSDSLGRYRLGPLQPGPGILTARAIGFAPRRLPIQARAGESLVLRIELASSPLRLPNTVVTADPAGRARGELGTATVIGRDAIAMQGAATLAGVLELVPGTILQPPGLDGVQQATLRAVPISTGATLGGPAQGDLASFGTLIVMDGVPVSNNANLQTAGPRAEIGFPSSAGGGIDLRRVPASTIERVDVIRGVPSARYGDLTHGAIIVDTRAGIVAPELMLRYDPYTLEATMLGGRPVGSAHTVTTAGDYAHTLVDPGRSGARTYRVAAQFQHRWSQDARDPAAAELPGWVLDTRVDIHRLQSDVPRPPDGSEISNSNRESGVRVSHRTRHTTFAGSGTTATLSLDVAHQRSFAENLKIRPAMPFTDRLEEGRAIGRFVLGQYAARLIVDGRPALLYGRLEHERHPRMLGERGSLRTGMELKREWTGGEGYVFDIAFPPQTTFTGVEGFDRPRSYEGLPPIGTMAAYGDARWSATPMRIPIEGQTGVRITALETGRGWSRHRNRLALEPRLNLQFSPLAWVRVRGAWGRVVKTPSLGDVAPARQFYDLVNVNWFTNDPAERLAVLTTFIRDPAVPDIGFSTAVKREVGIELDSPWGGTMSLTAFRDRVHGGVMSTPETFHLLRERYALDDSTTGSGQPPGFVEPAYAIDTIPMLLDRPRNAGLLGSEGIELSTAFPEVAMLRTRFDVQGAWIRTSLRHAGLEISRTRFEDFQLDSGDARIAYYAPTTRTGSRHVLTARAVHHQPTFGLIITGIFQYLMHEDRRDRGRTDSASFIGYVTRDGSVIPVADSLRGDPPFTDLVGTRGLLVRPFRVPDDWMASLQVAKALPGDGRLTFFAFNALDRQGTLTVTGRARAFASLRYGVELTMPFTR